MTNLVYTARRLVGSNLGWFLKTRETIGEAAGRERAININRDVLECWFPNRDPDDNSPIPLRTRYYDGADTANPASGITHDARTIRLQGGGNNWRLAGDGIKGDFYDVRERDLLFMVFDKRSATLSWVVVRHGEDPARLVPPEEVEIHAWVETALGVDARNMWIVDIGTAVSIIKKLKKIYPTVGGLLMEEQAFLDDWLKALGETGFVTTKDVARRFLFSLKAKRFLILTGLSGSGKTLLARCFSHWICDSEEQYTLVPVGANWTSNENIIGYPDALDPGLYQKTQALELILRASRYPAEPHFLILDEMNLSHVERYFADLLSAIESPDEPIRLHHDAEDRDGVPPQLGSLPKNIFIIGTVNVDETTYMFSPKVLDRANVLEFRTSNISLDGFLSNLVSVDPSKLNGRGEAFGAGLVDAANEAIDPGLGNPRVLAIVKAEMLFLFELFEKYYLEFSFRTAFEMLRFVELERRLLVEPGEDDVNALLRRVIDVQIMQKLLPRLHGSRKKLEPILSDLLVFTTKHHTWSPSPPDPDADPKGMIANLTELNALIADVRSGVKDSEETIDPFYPVSEEKIRRMRRKLEDGFTSFSEA